MEVSYDIVKRFQFDLEMGIFKNDYIRTDLYNFGVIRVCNRDEFLLVTYILNYIRYDTIFCSDIKHFFLTDNFPLLILMDIDRKRYSFITHLSEYTISLTNGIPSYLQGIKVELK